MGILDLPAILVGKQRRRFEKVPTDGEGSDRCAIQMSHLAGHPQHVAASPTKRSSQPNEVAPRSVFLASEDASYRGCFLYQRVLHPNGGSIVGSQIGAPGLGSILRRPALPAVVLGLPFLLFVPEAAHAGNADRSPFRAHRCSPVVRQCLVGKRCIRRSGSDGW